jgi:hypothetical protein
LKKVHLPGFTADKIVLVDKEFNLNTLNYKDQNEIIPQFRIRIPSPREVLGNVEDEVNRVGRRINNRVFENFRDTSLPGLPIINWRGCVYGRWCGAGCGGTAPPKDSVDECCMKHDKCYNEKGYFHCGCDKELLRCLDKKRDLRTNKGRYAHVIYNYFKLQSVNCR